MGSSSGAPRRFRMRNARPPFSVCSAMRSTAGVGSFAARGVLKSMASVRPVSAASCNRLRKVNVGAEIQLSTAPQAFEASACSVAQSVSRSLRVRTMTKFASSMPAAASAGAYGRCGGAIQASRSPAADSRASAGPSTRSSPMPSCAGSSSVRLPTGQPFPGSSSSRRLKPEETLGTATRARSLARHNWGCVGSGLAAARVAEEDMQEER